jgi:hypothetical protein
MKLIRVTKAGEVFLLVAPQPMEARDIADVVDHVDVHYTLGSEKATKALGHHDIHMTGNMRFRALIGIEGNTVSTLKL